MKLISKLAINNFILILLMAANIAVGQNIKTQKVSTIKVTKKNFTTLEVLTNHGTFKYHIDNTGDVEVSEVLQLVFDEISSLKDVSATFIFSPGIYYVDAPLSLKIAGIKLIGHGHGGIDIHGANLATGTIFRFGKHTGPHCITFNYAGRSKSFPAGEKPWPNKNLKVEVQNISFVGYNNTGVNTADGYCRWRKDKPLFKSLHWYPSKDRYKNAEKEGQRALYLPEPPKREGWSWSKCELLRITGCHFTDLYVGVEAAYSDVSYIDKNWFGQLSYGIRLNGPGMMINNNLFADLETALTVKNTTFSAFSNNTFAYVSKCFDFHKITHSTINGNALVNHKKHTGSAAFGGFLKVEESTGLNVTGNSVGHQQDSRKKTITVDLEPNGQSFIQFNKSNQLNFSNNIINTKITQTVIRLHNCKNSVIVDNIISFGKGGNAVAETGECENNYYRPIDPKMSAPFDEYKY